MRSILRRFSRRHTIVVAYLALFAALGGSAYAAVTVTGTNIKDGTITGRDVRNRSLDVSELSTEGRRLAEGQAGPRPARQGPEGRDPPAHRWRSEGPAPAAAPPGPERDQRLGVPRSPASRSRQNGFTTWSVNCARGDEAARRRSLDVPR